MSRTRFQLTPHRPYSLDRTVERLVRFSNLLEQWEQGRYRRLLRVGDSLVLMTVTQQGSPSRAQLEVELEGERVGNKAVRLVAERYVSRALGAGVALRPFYRAFAEDSLLSGSIRSRRGLRVAGAASVFESILTAILAQQVNLTFAYSIRDEFAERHGERLDVAGVSHLAFPRPEAIAPLRIDALRRFRLSRNKAVAIQGIARAFAAGDLDEDKLHDCSDEEIVERLTSYKGIGRWTAEIALLRGMSRPDIFPAGDLSIVKNLAIELLGKSERASEAEMRSFSERWRPHRSLALIYAHAALADRRASS